MAIHAKITGVDFERGKRGKGDVLVSKRKVCLSTPSADGFRKQFECLFLALEHHALPHFGP
jgi:hypothetical protein